MTSLYSINLHIMGKSNIPLLTQTTFANTAEKAGAFVFGGRDSLNVWGWEVSARDASIFVFVIVVITMVSILLYLFFGTDIGTAMRASVDKSRLSVHGL